MIDCHLHLQDPVFEGRTAEIIGEARNCGVTKVVVNGTCPGDWKRVGELSSEFEEVVPFFGLHPWKVNEVSEGWEAELESWLNHFPEAGVGEIGLDRWIRGHDIEKQRTAFQTQLEMAHALSRPVTIHCLRAWGHLIECLDQSGYPGHVLLHSFSGPGEMIPELLKRGAYFSVSGYFFREDKVVKLSGFDAIPDERILIETDAPDMLPPEELAGYSIPVKGGERMANHPANLRAIYEAFANRRNIDLATLAEQVRENYGKWMSFPC